MSYVIDSNNLVDEVNHTTIIRDRNSNMKAQLIIRKASIADVETVLAIRKEAILSGCKSTYSASQLAKWTNFTVNDVITDMIVDSFYISEYKNTPVGTGAVDLTSGQIDGVFVLPAHTGNGFARQMLTFLEMLAKKHGLKRLMLESTLNAVSAYHACGFEGETQQNYVSPTGVTLRCVPMQKDIS